ncbi:MAG: Gfo/Idh/MocA family oxidoreductase [Bryobacteraceae bacterium]
MEGIFSWGILGAGDIAHRHMAPAMRNADGHRLVAIQRRDPAAARAFADAHGTPRIYHSEEDLLRDPEVNAVYIGTPPHLHCGQTVAAAEAGKHIICEKPIACTVAEAQTMIDACALHGVRLMICHYQRFNERNQRIRRMIEEGALGKVISVHLTFGGYTPPKAGEWRRDRARSGGGPLMDLGSHCLDLLMYFCGPIASAHSLVDNLVWQGEVEDTATLLLRTESGAHATVSTVWSAQLPDPEFSNSLEIWGTNGAIVTAPLYAKDSSGRLMFRDSAGVQDLSAEPSRKIHEAVLEGFAHAVNTGGPIPAPAEDALRGLEIIQAAYR